MRIAFLFATSKVADLDALPEGVQVFRPENGNGLTVRLPGLEYPESDLLLRFLGARVIGGATWRLWLVLPVSLDWRQGARVARFIRRVALARPAAVKGPWSLREFAESFPTVAAEVLGPQLQPPEVLAGDEPEAMPSADYRPTDAEAHDNAEPDPATIFLVTP